MSKTLTVPYHQQDWYPSNTNKNDGNGYCGAACAQMVLQSINAGVIDQPTLFNDAKNHTVAKLWYMAPDGLRWVLNDRMPATFGGWFFLNSLATEDAISRKIVWTIHHYDVAPIASVYKGDHWVAVTGYASNADPADADDTSYTISSITINDPFPPVAKNHKPPPPPHDALNKCKCGTGIDPVTKENRGTANSVVNYSFWQSSYMTPVNHKYNKQWNGKFVAVCDPDPPPVRQGAVQPRHRRRAGDRLLSEEEAIELAQSELERSGVLELPQWLEVFSGTQAGKPLLVQRLDELDSFYFIVPFAREGRETSGVVTLDARFGDYQQITGLPGGVVFSPPSQDEILDKVVGREIPLGEREGTLLVRPEAFTLYPLLLWQPCRESLSPLCPFYMVVAGRYRIYIRIDGEIFTDLHTGVGGV